YAKNIADKVSTVEAWMQGGVMKNLKTLAREVKGEVRGNAANPQDKSGGQLTAAADQQNKGGEQPKTAAEADKGDQGKAEPAGPPAPAAGVGRPIEVVPEAPSLLAQWPESLGRVA